VHVLGVAVEMLLKNFSGLKNEMIWCFKMMISIYEKTS
jgi:hypothetical protein